MKSLILSFFLLIICSQQTFISSNYTLDYQISNLDIQLTITARNQGWVGLGFGSSMFSAEIFICSYDSSNNLIISHYNSNDEVTPHLINQQNVILLSGFRNTTHTSCTFQRGIYATTNSSFNVTFSKPMDLIYAYGQTDTIEYHIQRDLIQFTFFTCGSYCGLCDYNNKICLKCISPAVIVDSICQIFVTLSPKFNISYYPLDEYMNVSFTIIAENQGWVALGLGSSMIEADIFKCNETNSVWNVLEFKSNVEDVPNLDEIQNVELISGSRNTTHTTCTFKRNLKTNDINDTTIYLDQETNIIYAYGDSDSFTYHNDDRGNSIIRIQQSLDFNDNATLCAKGDQNNRCIQCKYENFAAIDGKCEENYIQESYEYINENISIFYYIINNTTLSLTLSAKSQGWIAVGLGSSMFKADIFMCHINTTENMWEGLEFKSIDEAPPTQDNSQNLILLSAFRNTSHTVCSFQRDLKTNDTSDTTIFIGNNTNLIYAMGSDDTFTYHNDNRGQFSMAFNNNSIPVCDEVCDQCEANNLCKSCKYSNFEINNGKCEENFAIEKSLIKMTNFSIYYYLLDSDYISITMVSNEPGWLAIGLNLNTSSLEDLFMCHATVNNTWEALEYKYNETYIALDKIQNIELITASRSGNQTSCMIKRKLITNDSSDIIISLNNNINLNYGYDNSDSFVSFSAKGSLQANFTNGTTPPPSSCSPKCLECSSDNKSCLKCNYNNYNLVSGVCEENYSIEKFVNLATNFTLYYIIDNDEISISLIYISQGWIALGLGSLMSNSDMYMCNMSSEQNWQAIEMKPQVDSPPLPDPSQDLTFIEASSNSTHRLCTFRRKLISKDTTDKDIAVNQYNDVIFALGQSDEFIQHIHKGISSVNFSNSTIPSICPSSCSKCDSNGFCISCVENNLVVINGICQQNDIDMLPSSAVILPDIFTLYWNFKDDNVTVQLMIKTSNMGYISLGIGNCMDNCDVHVAQYDPYSNIQMLDMYSSSYSTPQTDKTNDLNLLGYGVVNGSMFIKYERKINTGDKSDFSLTPGNIEMAYAYSGGKRLEYHHNNRGRFNVDFVQGYNGGVALEDLNSLARLHGILLFVAWGGLIDIALFFGRYLKTFKCYMEFHGFLLFSTSVLSTVMEIVLIYKNRSELANLDADMQLRNAHFIIGVLIMGLFMLEMALGLVSRSLILKKNKFINNTNIKLIHRIIGIVIYLATKANIGIGIKLFKESLLIPLVIYYCVLFSFKAAIEIIFKMELKVFLKNPRKLSSSSLLSSDLVSKINSNTPREYLLSEFPQFSWVILDRQIYDISDLVHPGGNYIIEKIKGREIGRFFYGISGLESLPLPAYKHSIYAMNYLNSRLIGNIDNANTEVLLQKKNLDCASIASNMWIINDKLDLSKTTSLFRFRSSEFVVKNYIKGLEWMGKHFTVQEAQSINKLTRLYTTVLCFSSQNTANREKLIKYYESVKKSEVCDENVKSLYTLTNITNNNKSEMSESGSDSYLFSDELTLIIKNYNRPLAFSNYIHNNINRNYIIRGNFGNGLELHKESSGIHYIFAGGTGILPFMDLLDYLLKKAIFSVLQNNDKAEAIDSLNIYKEDYQGSLNNQFKLVLFAAFTNDEEFIGSDIIVKLYEIIKTNNYGWFDMKIRMASKETKFINLPLVSSHFDEKFIAENVKKGQDLKRIYICGSTAMNKKVHEGLVNYQIDESIINFI